MKHQHRSRAVRRLVHAAAVGTMAWSFPALAATWTDAVSGDWSDGTLWTPNTVPSFADSATINATGAAFTLTVDAPTVVDRVVLDSADATLLVVGGITVYSSFEYASGAIDGTVHFTPNGTLNLGTGPVNGGSFVLQGDGIVGGGGPSGVTVQSGVNITSRAVTSLGSILYLHGSQSANFGTITLETAAGVASGSTLSLTGTYTNAGTINFNAGGIGNFRTVTGGTLTNSGTLNVNARTTFAATNVVNTGTISVAAGTFLLTLGHFTQSAGALNISSIANGGSSFTYNGGAINGTVRFENAVSLNFGTDSLSGGNFLLNGGGIVGGGGPSGVTIQSGISISSRGASAQPSPILTLQGLQSANLGVITLETSGGLNSPGSTLSLNGTFTNAGTMNFNAGGTGADLRTVNGTAVLANSGTMNVNADTTLSSSTGLTNAGTINIATGKTLWAGSLTQSGGNLNISGALIGGFNFTYTGGAVNGTVDFTNSTVLTLGAASLGGGTFLLAGGGTVQGLGGGNTTLQSGLTVISRGVSGNPSPFLTFNGTSSANAGVITLETAAGVSSTGSTLSLNGTFTNAGTMNFNAGGTGADLRNVNGVAVLANSGTMNVNADTTLSSSTGLTNAGTINIAAGRTLWAGTMTQSAGALNISGALGGGFNFTYTGGAVNGTVDFTNSTVLTLGAASLGGGTFLLAGGGTVQGLGGGNTTLQSGLTVISRGVSGNPSPFLTFNGTSSANAGVITLETAAGVSSTGSTLNLNGTFTNAGTMNFNAGGTGADLRNVNGVAVLANSGTMNVNTGTTLSSSTGLTNTGTVNIATGKTLWAGSLTQSGGNLNISGTMLGGSNFTYTGGAINGTVDFTTSTVLNLGNQSVASGTFLLAGGGIVQAAGGGDTTLQSGLTVISRGVSANPSPILTLGGIFSANAGVITLDTAAGVNSTGSTLGFTGAYFNRGTINFNAGGTGAQVRTVSGSGGVFWNDTAGTINVNTPIAFSSATFQNLGTVNYNTSLTIGGPGLTSSGGIVNIASGATLTAPTTSLSGGQLNISGSLNPNTFWYSGGSVNGTVHFLATGAPTKFLRLGQQSVATGTFIFSGNGGVTGTPAGQGVIGQGTQVISRVTSGTNTLSLTAGVQNRGTITLEATSDASSSAVGAISVVGSFTNHGTINFNGGAVLGPNARSISGGTLTNSAGATFNFNGGSTTTFHNPVVNNGTFKNTDSTVIFLGAFTNNGQYFSDPAVNTFTDLEVGPDGYLVGGAGDQFVIGGNFTNASTRKDDWNTTAAKITFTAGAEHVITVVGHGEFAFGQLEIEAGATVVLTDGDGEPGGGIYATELLVPTVNGAPDLTVLATPEDAPALTLYLDPSTPANQTILEYVAQNPSQVPAGVTVTEGLAPEPGTTSLVALAGVGLLRRRRRGV